METGILSNPLSDYVEMHTYVETAVIRNITENLKYLSTTTFKDLRSVYENNDVTSLVNWILVYKKT